MTDTDTLGFQNGQPVTLVGQCVIAGKSLATLAARHDASRADHLFADTRALDFPPECGCQFQWSWPSAHRPWLSPWTI